MLRAPNSCITQRGPLRGVLASRFPRTSRLIVRVVSQQSRGPVSLLFRAPYETALGEELLVTGQGNEALGEWVPQQGIKLSWTEGHQWKSTQPVRASPDSVLKFKVVLLRGSNHVYEPGPDRVIDCATAASAVGSAHMEVLCQWGGQPSQLLPAPSPPEAIEPAGAAPAAEEQQAALPIEPLQFPTASMATDTAPTGDGKQAPNQPMLRTITTPSFETQLGQYLVVVGSSRELGAWVPESGLAMQWQPGHAWKAELPLTAGEDVQFKLAWFNGGAWVWEKGPNRTLRGLDGVIAEQQGAIPENTQAHITCPWEAPLHVNCLQAPDSSAEQQQQQQLQQQQQEQQQQPQQQQHSVANDVDGKQAAAERASSTSSAIAREVPSTEDGTLAGSAVALAAAEEEEANGDGMQQQQQQQQALQGLPSSSVNGNGSSADTNTAHAGSLDGSVRQKAASQQLLQMEGRPDARDAEIQMHIFKRQTAEWALQAQRLAVSEAVMGQEAAREEVRTAETRVHLLSQELRAAQQQAEQLAIEAQERMISLGLELAGFRQQGRIQSREMARMKQEITEMALKQAEEMKLRNQELAEVQAKHAAQMKELRAELQSVREAARCQLELVDSEVKGLERQLLQAQADLQGHESQVQQSVASREALVMQHAQELKEQQETQVQHLREVAQHHQAMQAEQSRRAASALQLELQAANERAQAMECKFCVERQATMQMAESKVLALQNELSEMRARLRGATALATPALQAGDLKGVLSQIPEETAQLKSGLEKANIDKAEEIARLKESLAYYKREVARLRPALKSGAQQVAGMGADLTHRRFGAQLEGLEEAMEDIKHSLSRGLGLVIALPRQLRHDKPVFLLDSPAESERPGLMVPLDKQQEEQQLQQQQQQQQQKQQQRQQQQQQKPLKGLFGMISSFFGFGKGRDTKAAGSSNGTANNVVTADGPPGIDISHREQMSARK